MWMSGSQISLLGVSEGTATVTVAASNSAGSASQKVTASVYRAAAPTVGMSLGSRTVAVGSVTYVEVSQGFGGLVESYAAASSDTGVVSVSVVDSTLVVTAVATGSADVTVTATNKAGSVSAVISVTVSDLTLSVSAPSHCLGSEGIDVNGRREGVGTMALSYTVSGGTAPYAVSSPAVTGTRSTATGVLLVSCARQGINLNNVGAGVDVVASGPKTVSVAVADAAGVTVTESVTVTVAEDVYTSEFSGGSLVPGRTYVVGDNDAWALITLPEGLSLSFEGLTESGGEFIEAHFSDKATGSLIVLDWETGREVAREVIQAARSEGSATPPHDVGKLFDELSGSAATPAGVTRASAVAGGATTWRPYRGLPADARVLIEDRMLEGGPTFLVCNVARRRSFKQAHRLEYMRAFNNAILKAIDIWNEKMWTKDPATGTSHKIFRTGADCRSSSKLYPGDIQIEKAKEYTGDCDNLPRGISEGTPQQVSDHKAFVMCRDKYLTLGHWKPCKHSGGCAFRRFDGTRPPKINRGAVRVVSITQEAERTDGVVDESAWTRQILHELGHFLGLGDYKYNCPTADRKTRTLYAYPPKTAVANCVSTYSDLLTTRDLEDLHHMYHPDALVDLRVSGTTISGTLPLDAGRPDPKKPGSTLYTHEYNAFGYVVGVRSAASSGDYKLLGGAPIGRVADAGGAVRIDLTQFDLPKGFDLAGKEFVVAGVTRGDWKRGHGSPKAWEAHSEISATIGSLAGSWTLGTPATVFGPPAAPTILGVYGGDRKARVFWYPVARAARYILRWGTSANSLTSSVIIGSPTTAHTVSGLRNNTTYYFAVRAVGSDNRAGGQSAPRSGRPSLVASPTGLAAYARTFSSVSLSWDSVTGATGYEVRVRTAAAGSTAAEGDSHVSPRAQRDDGQTVRVTTGSATIQGLDAGAAYQIDVRAELETRSPESGTQLTVSEWSSAVTVTTRSASPTPLPPPPPPPPPPPTTTTTTIATTTTTTTGTATPLPDKAPATPTGVSAVATLGSATVTWNRVTGATSYDVRRAGLSPVRTSGSSQRFGGLSQWTQYRFSVRARNAAGTSSWVTTTVRTPARVSGQVAVLRMAPTRTGYTLSFGFRPTGEAIIKPTLRFLRFNELSPNWWIKSSTVTRSAVTPAQTLGKVTAGKTSGGKIRVCFLPDGAANRFCPRTHTIGYDAMVLNRWYFSSTFSFTVHPATALRSESEDPDERSAHALPPGETVCGHC